MPIISLDIGIGPEGCFAPGGVSNFNSWMENRLDRSKDLKKFTIFNKLPPELRLKIWCHCMPPPGRAVFFNRMGHISSFLPDEDVLALPDNFFWGRTPAIFQVCQESRYIGKLRVFRVTGLSIFYGGSGQFHPTFQVSTQCHPRGFVLQGLWFSRNDTIEMPIRSTSELGAVRDAAAQIGREWVKEGNPLRFLRVQFSFFLSSQNQINPGAVQHITSICELVSELGPSAIIFIGMGAGYAHKKSRFFLNDDQERWTYNEDGTFCYPELNNPQGSASAWDPPRSVPPTIIRYAVRSYQEAYTYCLNSEILEEHIAKANPRIRYVDQIRATLVKDGFAGGWEKGEAWRRGLSFDKTGLLL
ncbi:hypothetical protein V492_07054 [Pseudogymnoascus sp. VKM F-4246]|nr:hypothetical protein V492_07054 [Pseudogymnoascus sp. VKM F-4246]